MATASNRKAELTHSRKNQGLLFNEREQSGDALAKKRLHGELTHPKTAGHSIGGRVVTNSARNAYKKLLKQAIYGGNGILAPRQPIQPIVSGMGGGNLTTQATGVEALHHPQNLASKRISDSLSAHSFMYGASDMPAYHRRIENITSFSHSPRFGF